MKISENFHTQTGCPTCWYQYSGLTPEDEIAVYEPCYCDPEGRKEWEERQMKYGRKKLKELKERRENEKN